MSLLIVGLLWLIQAGIMKDNYLNERIKTIDSAITNATQTSVPDFTALEANYNIGLLLVDGDGNIAYMSQGLPMRGMITHQLPAMAEQSQNGKVVYLQNASANARYAAIGVDLSEGSRMYAVFSLVDVDEASRILLQQLWIITAVLVVISVLISFILARMFAHPIRKVTQAAHEIAAGRLDIHLPVLSKDEVGQLTEALNEMAAELKKTENLRHELIANVSHELRSPLAVIQGFAETVRDVTWPDETKRGQQLTIISDEASRLNKTVNDILDYSRLQAGVDTISVSHFALCPVLAQIIQHYALEAEKKNVSLRLTCADISIWFDANRFIQVMNNLLNNALNHAEEGSSVYLCARQQDSRARISVKNTGNTIPAEALKNIWERYYRSGQTKDNKPLGTGLGLSIVKTIFELHHAAYGVTSENSETEFWFEAESISGVSSSL
jgi:signal transduction histidine kinase